MGVSQFKQPVQQAPRPQQGNPPKGHPQRGEGPQKVNPTSSQSPRWELGIDRSRVAAFIGVALIAGFGFGYLAARYLANQGNDGKGTGFGKIDGGRSGWGGRESS